MRQAKEQIIRSENDVPGTRIKKGDYVKVLIGETISPTSIVLLLNPYLRIEIIKSDTETKSIIGVVCRSYIAH